MAVHAGPRVLAVCGMPFEAALARGPGVDVVCGPGAARVARALARALAGTLAGAPRKVPAPGSESGTVPDGAPWAGIVSFGCAAGLDPALAPGTCIVATDVLTPAGPVATDADWTRALLAWLPGARAARLAGVDVPLATPSDKAGLWRASGAAAADMETHAAARAARQLGLPFAACRVVFDPAWRGVPPCALAGLRPDGRIAPWAVLRAVAGDPAQATALCALAHDAWTAHHALRRVHARLHARAGAPFGLRIP